MEYISTSSTQARLYSLHSSQGIVEVKFWDEEQSHAWKQGT